jgi:hypothetical protein
MKIPATAVVRYVDRLTLEDARREYPELLSRCSERLEVRLAPTLAGRDARPG